jgi:hypothetical protein
MTEINTGLPTHTSNGEEIQHPREVLQYSELRDLLTTHGLSGENPQARAEALRHQTKESLALFYLM